MREALFGVPQTDILAEPSGEPQVTLSKRAVSFRNLQNGNQFLQELNTIIGTSSSFKYTGYLKHLQKVS